LTHRAPFPTVHTVCGGRVMNTRPIPSMCSAGCRGVETMTEFMTGADTNNAGHGNVTGPVSLKHIARRAAHAAERDVILQVLHQTQWNRVRAAKLLEISYRALLYKIKDLGLASASHRGPRAPERSRLGLTAVGRVRCRVPLMTTRRPANASGGQRLLELEAGPRARV
jgi:hypothetical protein